MNPKPCQGTAKRVVLSCAMIVGFAVLGFSQVSPAWAVPVTAFDGNVAISGPGGLTSTINYAVFQITTPAEATLFGTTLPFVHGAGSPAFDATLGNFVYLYQPSNTGTPSVATFSQSLGLAATSPSSYGYYDHTLFTDSGTHVNAGHALTANTSPGFASSAVADKQINPAGFFGAMTCDPVPANGVILASSSLQTSYCNNPPSLTDLATGDTSSLVAFTSNVGPEFATGSVQGGGSSAVGADPAPSPEPSTALLSSIGFLALAGTWAKGKFRLMVRARA